MGRAVLSCLALLDPSAGQPEPVWMNDKALCNVVYVYCVVGVLFWRWYDIPHRHSRCTWDVVEFFWLSWWSCLWGVCII